jgi:hypothetical protein
MASKTTRRIHIPSRNTQDTINSAFEKIAEDKAPVVGTKVA